MFDIPYLFNPGTNRSPVHRQSQHLFIRFTWKVELKIQDTQVFLIVLFIITAALGSIVFYINRDKDEIAAKKQLKSSENKLLKKLTGVLDYE